MVARGLGGDATSLTLLVVNYTRRINPRRQPRPFVGNDKQNARALLHR